jgi:hypothetical protein
MIKPFRSTPPAGLSNERLPTYGHITTIALPKLASGKLDLELEKKTEREPCAALTTGGKNWDWQKLGFFHFTT